MCDTVLEVRPFAYGGYEFPYPVHDLCKPPVKETQKKNQQARGVANLMKFLNSPLPPPVDPKKFKKSPDPTISELPLYPEPKKKAKNRLVGNQLTGTAVHLLSSEGRDYLELYDGGRVRVEDCVKGKKLLVCCFMVPLPVKRSAAEVCCALISAYPQLIKQHGHEFEMVMVAKMRTGFEADKAAFRHFFSAFPCPAIPFEDYESRDYVCRTLGLTAPGQSMSALIFDEKQQVLQSDCYFLPHYGAASFPFTASRLSELQFQCHELRHKLDQAHWYNPSECLGPVTLQNFFGFDDLLRFDNFSGGRISLGVLSKTKCIAVYLCVDGMFMGGLNEIHLQCVEEGLEFEVVVVCMPCARNNYIPSFVDDVMLTLKERQISSWWFRPYNDEVSRRLWSICPCIKDKVIVLVDGKGDLKGKEVMRTYRIGSYPFTRLSIVEKNLSQLKSLTLASVLWPWGSEQDGSLLLRDSEVPMAEVLKKKRILLYIDYLVHKDPRKNKLFARVLEAYKRIENNDADCEVIFVPMGTDMSSPDALERVSIMPWPRLPPARSASVFESLFFKEMEDVSPCLVAFDENGQILSKSAVERLTETGLVDGSLFKDTIRDDIVVLVDDDIENGDY